MENAYSITVTNKFSLGLDEDEDPLEVLKIRELEREAKRIEKREKQQSEKENKNKTEAGQKSGTAAPKAPKSRVIKDVEKPQVANKNQDNKKDQEKKSFQPRTSTGDRNVKFSGESREERLNRRNREDGDNKPPRSQNDSRRGPPGDGRPREFRGDNSRDFNDRRERGDRPERGNREFGDRRERGEGRPERGNREFGERGNREFGERGNREFADRRERGGERLERSERGDRGDRNDRGDFGSRGDRPDRDEKSGGGRGRGGGIGDRFNRSAPRGRGSYDNRGKREFDRQSGSDKTGVKPIDKKDGAGSHNWGSNNDEIEEVLKQDNNDWNVTENPDGETTLNTTETKEGEIPTDNSAEEKPVEEEMRELTLDEWKAQRSSRAKPQFNVRKAGEGEDPTRWKKMYALEKKKEGETEEDEEDEEYDTADYPQRVGRLKRVLGIEINFGDTRRRAGPRGNQGGGRGGRSDRGGGDRGFGGNRGPKREGGGDERRSQGPVVEPKSPHGNRQNAPKVDDEHDFPSLG